MRELLRWVAVVVLGEFLLLRWQNIHLYFNEILMNPASRVSKEEIPMKTVVHSAVDVASLTPTEKAFYLTYLPQGNQPTRLTDHFDPNWVFLFFCL